MKFVEFLNKKLPRGDKILVDFSETLDRSLKWDFELGNNEPFYEWDHNQDLSFSESSFEKSIIVWQEMIGYDIGERASELLKEWKNSLENWGEHGAPFLGFTKKITQLWVNNNFTKEQTRDWLNTGIEPLYADYCAWLRDELEITANYYLNSTSEEKKTLKHQFKKWGNNPTAKYRLKKESYEQNENNLGKNIIICFIWIFVIYFFYKLIKKFLIN